MEKYAAVLFSADPIQQASKFCEIAAFAKRTTGNCLGLIDSVARYRKKLWKSTEGHRQFSRLKQHSPPLLSYMSSVLIYRDHLVPLYFIHLILSRVIQITAINQHSSPYVSYILRFLTCHELIVHSSSSPPEEYIFGVCQIEWASARVPPTPPIWGVLQREGER